MRERVRPVELHDLEEQAPRHAEVAGQALDDSCAVVGALPVLQLGAHDALADLPVGLDADVVDGLIGAVARRFQQATHLAQQRVVLRYRRDLGHHITSLRRRRTTFIQQRG